MVKQSICGIEVPAVATPAELRAFVHKVHIANNENFTATADALGVTPATVWKLEKEEQMDSKVLRDSTGIRKTPDRPRVWMPTNNCERAMEKMFATYSEIEIYHALISCRGKKGVNVLIGETTWQDGMVPR